jgi:amidase
MKLAEYANYDALGLAELVRTKQVSADELARTAVAAIEKINPKINAIVEVYFDQLESNENVLGGGPFRGVPFIIKDIGPHIGGRKVEFASRLCKGMVGKDDSYFGMLLRQSGVNILGRSNTPEFSMCGATENLLYGATRNPWMPSRSTNGSSGGSAASVASGVVPMAHGSDIGGSIRGPAAWCGGVGLKPSRGRISSGPMLDEWGFGMSMHFVQTRTIRDTAAMLDCLAVPQPGDPFIIRSEEAPYAAHVRPPRRPLRIAWSATPLIDAPVDCEISALVLRTAEVLSSLGHLVFEAAPAIDLAEVERACLGVWYFGFDRRLDSYAQQMGRRVDENTVERGTMNFYNYAKSAGPDQFLEAWVSVNKARRAMGAFFETCDVWVTPTAAQTAVELGVFNMDVDLPPEEFLLREERTQQFMVACNVSGQPAISLPLGIHTNGLPIGVQLVARPGEDRALIELGASLEEVMPWRDRLAPIHAAIC